METTLKYGRKHQSGVSWVTGTAMAAFIPTVLTEEEAWQVIWFVRSFGRP